MRWKPKAAPKMRTTADLTPAQLSYQHGVSRSTNLDHLKRNGRLMLGKATVELYDNEVGPEIQGAYGLILHTVRRVRPASDIKDILGVEAYEAVILAHQRRVAAEMGRRESESAAARRGDVRVTKEDVDNAMALRTGDGRKLIDVRRVNCCRCRCELLAASEEHLRKQITRHGKPRAITRFLPPAVADTIGGRPVCSPCLAEGGKTRGRAHYSPKSR